MGSKVKLETVVWNDIENSTPQYYKNICRVLVSETEYKNIKIKAYKCHKFVTSANYDFKKIGCYYYSFTAEARGQYVKCDNGGKYFVVAGKASSYKRSIIKTIDDNYYLYSGDKKFDLDNKIQMEIDENRRVEVLKNMEKYERFFPSKYCASNAYVFVEKCILLYDEFKKVFESYNRYLEEKKRYNHEYDTYMKLPSKYRDQSVIDKTIKKEHRNPIKTVDHSFWGTETVGGELYYTYEHTYKPNDLYVSPPSNTKLNSLENESNSLAKALKEKLKNV